MGEEFVVLMYFGYFNNRQTLKSSSKHLFQSLNIQINWLHLLFYKSWRMWMWRHLCLQSCIIPFSVVLYYSSISYNIHQQNRPDIEYNNCLKFSFLLHCIFLIFHKWTENVTVTINKKQLDVHHFFYDCMIGRRIFEHL